ncbi:MAG TPA: DinB family protein [Cyclobacteriaceae bacterium]|nr:DinB family protein [Cyclobacteriaceae bacterium]HMV08800.1 DinB family protein [Cyclobacteriaceae bacterium]HMV90536.1 DinB family protein [Cyclobacteriaceae bacterium]HMW99946.1 DinB family protein [Cyclobacteriaceae bacterium]HMX49191.1 DinB family protein [Cyclobacteriaceae bacterium]
MVKQAAHELRQIITHYSAAFTALPESGFSAKPNPEKWSQKEIVGHLIDSAQNNLRRFIVGQYDSVPPHIVYDQNFWVNANGYQKMTSLDVIVLWTLVNFRICAILENMPETNYTKKCNTGKGNEQLYTLEWLAQDYVKHLKHHVNQVIPGSFDVMYHTY